jgi:hypothetical protein
MRLSHQIQNQTEVHTREFECWRGLEEGDKYECIIEALTKNQIRISLDVVELCVNTKAAIEIADCLRDAFSIALYGEENPYGERDLAHRHIFQTSSDRRLKQYRADGEVEVTSGSADFGNDEGLFGNTPISIQTISGGGYEVVFDFMGYSFAIQDAIWMSNTLLAACGRPRGKAS